ncbi:MAG: SusC/RagA family TonB-linked outer membrane protein [Hyphomicrobiales bacterium]
MRKIILLLAFILMLSTNFVFAQTKMITGTVTGASDNMPVPGVTVYVKNTNIGTTTNIDGKYSLELKPKYKILVFSFVGLQTQEVPINGRSSLDVVMQEDALKLDEVVVTAIGIAKEAKALGYAVQQVDAEALSKTANTNLVNSLSGRVANVQVTSSAGTAGASSFITIRGSSSIIGNNQPLFVVDGIPIDNGGGQGGTGGVALSNRAIDLNPDDIESYEVLKGGAATALYGIRGANGVIVITTKKGTATKGNKINVTYNSSVTFEKVSQLPALTQKYGQGKDGKYTSATNLTWGPRLDTCYYSSKGKDENHIYGALVGPDDTTAMGKARAFDHYDLFETGIAWNNSIGLSGGNETSTFYISASDLHSKGIIPNNTFQRNTFKIAGQTKLSDKFRISGDANYTVSTGRRIQQGSNASGVMLGLCRTPASFNNAAGFELIDGTQRSFTPGYDNPYWTVNKNAYRDQVNRLIGKGEAQYLPTDWLSLTYRFGVDFYNRKEQNNIAKNSNAYRPGYSGVLDAISRDINTDLILNISHNINEDIALDLILGHNMAELYYYEVNAQANGLDIPEFYNISNSADITAGEATSKIRRAAFYGDFGVSYKNMLYLNVTGRNDWSTTLPKDNNSFFYPAVSSSFILTEIPAIKESISHILPFAKIRASYAIVASDASAYRTMNYYNLASTFDGWTDGIEFPLNYGGSKYLGYTLGNTYGSQTITPEKTKSWEVGLDLKFFNNRLGLDATYYNNKTEDALVPVQIARTTGFSSWYANSAVIESKGVEISLYVEPIRTKDFSWGLTANFTYLDNPVISLEEGLESLSLGGFTSAAIHAFAGRQYGTIVGADFQRNEKGEVLIKDNGYPIINKVPSALADVKPDFEVGIINDLRYKNVNLSFLWDFRIGGKMWNGTRGALYNFGVHEDQDHRDEYYVLEGVNVNTGLPNDVAIKRGQEYYKGIGAGGGFNGPPSQFIEDASWIRLRDVTLSYSFGEKVIGKNGFIKGLDVYFTGKNLLLFTPYKGVDPETSLYGASNAQGLDYFNMPGVKSYVFGLKLSL